MCQYGLVAGAEHAWRANSLHPGGWLECQDGMLTGVNACELQVHPYCGTACGMKDAELGQVGQVVSGGQVLPGLSSD